MFIEQSVDSPAYADRFINIKNYVLYSLGWPLVKVELTEKHILLAIVEAVTKYYQTAALDEEVIVCQVLSGNIIEIPNNVHKHMIKDVIIPIEYLDAYSRGFGAQIADEFGVYNMSSEASRLLLDFDMSRYYMYLQRLEDFRNITGTKPKWTILNNQISLTPTDMNIGSAGILIKTMPTEDELDQQMWIKEYALARSKHMLGTVRSKFSGFQSSNNNIASDGEALKTEAKEEIEKLLEQLNGMREPLPFLKG